MTRLLIVFLMTAFAVGGGLIYWSIYLPNQQKIKQENAKARQELPLNVEISSSSAKPNIESRIETLESSIAQLQLELAALNKPVTTQNATVKNIKTQPSQYIPLGSGGDSTALDWTTIDTFAVDIDPANYPGYSSMQLELSLRVYQGNGKSFARIYNFDDGFAIELSEVSTTSQDYTWVSSSNFKLPAGEKTYKIQLKTLTGYQASIQNARIKVNF